MKREDLLLKAAEQYGTPLFVYQGDMVIEKYHQLINSFVEVEVKIKYAMKALSNINIIKLLNKEGAGIDTVSIEEVKLALFAGVLPKDIIFTPNCVDFQEIEDAVKLGVYINIDNINTLEEFGLKYGNSYPVCIRINPHIYAGGNKNISVGHIDSKFGISIHQIKHVKRITNNYKIQVIGLHMHTGSDILDIDTFIAGTEVIFDIAEEFEDLSFIDLGSGFKVPYKDGDYQTDIKALGKKISKSFKKFCQHYGRNLELWFEPGKLLVSQAGSLLVKVNVVKQTTTTVFIGVDSGQNHLIRPMFYNAYHHIVNLSKRNERKKLYTIVGYICESDTFGYDRMIHEIHTDDILEIQNAGAYGYSMSNNYNSRLRPPEVLVMNDETHLIREREVFEDLVKHQIDIFK